MYSSTFESEHHISTIAKDFRSAWQGGAHPRIEEHLAAVSVGEQTRLFRELLSIEIACLAENGIDADVETYLKRFPKLDDVVLELFDSGRSFAVSMDSTAAADGDVTPKTLSTSGFRPPQLTRYRLIERVGRGGFGEVWRAFDEETQTYVAMKGPRSDRHITARGIEQFVAEAERIRRLNIDGVVTVLDVVHATHADGSATCFIVMELMDGGSLKSRMRQDYSQKEAINWVAQVADTLANLHRGDTVHRDIKPDNILFDRRGRVVLSDFGLAATEEEQLAERSSALGTTSYMAPEQARGTHVDCRADIYSLGVVLYRLLTKNKLPYLSNNQDEYLKQLLDPSIAPRPLPDHVPHRIAAICERCMQADPAQRYRSAIDMADDLNRWLHSGRRATYFMLSVVVTVMLLVAGLMAMSGGQETNDTDTANEKISADADRNPGSLAIVPVELNDGNGLSSDVLNEGQSLRLSSDDLRLVALGNLAANADETIEVELSLLNWSGQAGFFFGHRLTKEGHQRFEVIQLMSYEGNYRLERSTANIGRVAFVSSTQLCIADVATPRNRAQILKVIVRQGMIADILWNGESQLELFHVPPTFADDVADCSGSFGYYNVSATTTFSKLMIGDKPQTITQPLKTSND